MISKWFNTSSHDINLADESSSAINEVLGISKAQFRV